MWQRERENRPGASSAPMHMAVGGLTKLGDSLPVVRCASGRDRFGVLSGLVEWITAIASPGDMQPGSGKSSIASMRLWVSWQTLQGILFHLLSVTTWAVIPCARSDETLGGDGGEPDCNSSEFLVLQAHRPASSFSLSATQLFWLGYINLRCLRG